MLKRNTIEHRGARTRAAFESPTVWDVMRACVGRARRRGPGEGRLDHRRDSVLLDAPVAIRAGDCEKAEDMLAPFRSMLACDPAYLNLCGVICELQGQAGCANRFYGLAMGVDPSFKPAERNLRRIYELNAFGRTCERV